MEIFALNSENFTKGYLRVVYQSPQKLDLKSNQSFSLWEQPALENLVYQLTLLPNTLAKIINSDKLQVFKGLDIVTNKITDHEKKGVPHHLLGHINPEYDYTAQDFCYDALAVIQRVVRLGKIPVIAGGSNSFIEKLVEDAL